ncbi:hypothetical protein E4U43_002577 [Claviceps pusilla]|uniref:GEgh 16 protein n=1 Tax=Claviceps pusilla TaxID=123648 RepID=A0A9P7NFY7_9HYPO|nr:hypothetical protein E4U43_002577 [Claviceps pusilla]
MKTTFTALGMLAAVASAYAPGRHLHFRANGTADASTMLSSATGMISSHPTTTDCSDDGKLPVMTTQVTDIVTDKIYTMTMGSGTDAHLTTRTIRTTLQETITVPNTAAPTGPATTDRTTTDWETKKVTRTVVLHRKTTSTAGIPTAISTGTCPVSTVTVTAARETVTVPGPTVYVTVGASCSAGGASELPASQPTSTPNPTPTAAPYPTKNGTHPTSGHAKSTGFAHLR